MANEDKATRYQRLRRRATLAGVGSAGLVLGLALLLGSPGAASAAGTGGSSQLLTLIPAALGLLALCAAATFPSALYRDALLTRRYGVLRESPAAWIKAWAKDTVVTIGLGTVAVGVCAWLRFSVPAWWWLVGGVLAALGPFAVAKVIQALARPVPAGVPLGRPELRERLTQLAAKAGLPRLGLYQTNVGDRTRLANAAVVTVGNERRVLLSDTLLADHSDDEVEVVVAHELAHVVHRDVLTSQAVFAVLVAASLYGADAVIRWIAPGPTPVSPALLAPAFLTGGAVFLALRPLTLALSRRQERVADRYAARLSGNPEALASVVRRIAANNLADPAPSALVICLFHSHPSASERISGAATVDAR